MDDRLVRDGVARLNAYDLAARSYSAVYSTPSDDAESDAIFRRVLRRAGGDPPYLVDVGCADGIALRWLDGKVVYLGVDPSPGMIDAAHWRFPHHHFLLGTLSNVTTASADFVLGAFGPLIHIPKPETREFAHDVRRVLRPGGRFLVMGATRGVVRATGEPRVRHTAAVLEDAFVGAGLKNVQVLGFGRRRGIAHRRSQEPRRLPKPRTFVRSRWLDWNMRTVGVVAPDRHEWLVVEGERA